MTRDVDIEACKREVAKLTIVIEEDAGQGRNVREMTESEELGWKEVRSGEEGIKRVNIYMKVNDDEEQMTW